MDGQQISEARGVGRASASPFRELQAGPFRGHSSTLDCARLVRSLSVARVCSAAATPFLAPPGGRARRAARRAISASSSSPSPPTPGGEAARLCALGGGKAAHQPWRGRGRRRWGAAAMESVGATPVHRERSEVTCCATDAGTAERSGRGRASAGLRWRTTTASRRRPLEAARPTLVGPHTSSRRTFARSPIPVIVVFPPTAPDRSASPPGPRVASTFAAQLARRRHPGRRHPLPSSRLLHPSLAPARIDESTFFSWG